MIAWPAELPQRPTIDGYARGLPDGRTFRQMEAGPPKVRRRFSSAVRPIAVSFVMNKAQIMRFERFWDTDTRGGVLPFRMPDAMIDGNKVLASPSGDDLQNDEGLTLEIKALFLVMFASDAPEITPLSDQHYRVSFQLSVLP